MTLQGDAREVGVRALHDRLSEYLDGVEAGEELVVTRRGRPIARVTAFERDDPLAELARRGLVRLPGGSRTPRTAGIDADGSVSDLVAEQRR